MAQNQASPAAVTTLADQIQAAQGPEMWLESMTTHHEGAVHDAPCDLRRIFTRQGSEVEANRSR